MVDFIPTLDGYASGDGWPGFWGREGPEYLAWLGEQPPVTYLMGATTYRLMSGFAGGEEPPGTLLESREVAVRSIDVLLSDETGLIVDIRRDDPLAGDVGEV